MRAWHDKCSVFGIWNDPEAARMTYLGLYAQQHRGQESAGIVTLNSGRHLSHKGMGLVGEVFRAEDLDRLQGTAGIGHTRYSTTGASIQHNVQPLTAELVSSPVAVAHNGNLVNAAELRARLQSSGAIFHGTNDTECLLHLLARNPSRDVIQCLQEAASQMEGAYSFTILVRDRLIAMRDPLGFRPLVLGRRILEGRGQSYVVASETCAFDLIGAKYEREIEPGEIWWMDNKGGGSIKLPRRDYSSLAKASAGPRVAAKCVFEHVYFARPDSTVFGLSVYEARKRMGEILAEESGVAADMVVPVPDSGVPAAIGFARQSGLPFELGIIRNHYIGRTFIQPSQSIRSFGVKIKLNPQTEVLKGKRVVVIDDSMVRGTTSQKIIRLIRQAGAKEVHFRIASPPTTGPCFYGVDTPKKSQLIAAQQRIDQIRDFIGADTLAYLSTEGMMKAVRGTGQEFCAACFDGHYPTPLFGLDQE